MRPAFCSFVLVLTFCTLKANSQTSYYAAVGSNITLPCKHTYPTDNGHYQITWFVKVNSQDFRITFWHCGVFYEPLKGRVHHMPHSFQTSHCKGDASITISNLRLSDTGTYTCLLRNYEIGEERKMNLTVMEKPIEPVCGVEGEPAKGHGVTLKCGSSHDTLQLTYSWTKMSGNKMLPPNASVNATLGDLFVDRITEDNCGRYLCTVESLVATQHCDVLLECPPPSAMSDGVPVPVVAVTTVVLVLGLVGALAIWYWRRSETVEEVPMLSMEGGDLETLPDSVTCEHPHTSGDTAENMK
ncbi:coxsackievirus and adenovirus receptor homolog [Dunckerocampus dactyliophorus]|uniref:coxsackievirus and adenovirus receptor homolog n=1 Tax=Dunckerocampus dactyliophorus TaxID=161453 RepID=UPI002404BDF6|nr:coxsackievirus and adenovirus receptor homolog [Dunckerocampus dactyliophorus]XP_054643610.1 coxsackievirus and adenovirus receptor homolog [Dunckerocampus dactyliophorus]